MALTELQTNVVLDVYDHDGTRPQIKSIALDDNTRYVFARLTYKGQTYDIGSGATVKLIIIRPDKVGAQVIGEAKEYEDYNEDETVSNVYGAYAELDQPAIAVAGTLLGQFIITSGNQILRSQIFAVNNGEALDADEWAGQYDGYNLDELVEKVDNAVEKVDGMEADVNELKSGFSDLKEDLSAMSTASASDVGKALKAKTVTDGKVTEWEFGEAGGGTVELDATLTDSAKAAQAKAVGDNISMVATSSLYEITVESQTYGLQASSSRLHKETGYGCYFFDTLKGGEIIRIEADDVTTFAIFGFSAQITTYGNYLYYDAEIVRNTAIRSYQFKNTANYKTIAFYVGALSGHTPTVHIYTSDNGSLPEYPTNDLARLMSWDRTPYGWTSGYLDSSGVKKSDTTSIVTDQFIYAPKGTVVFNDNATVNMRVATYNAPTESSFISRSDQVKGMQYVISQDCYIRMAMNWLPAVKVTDIPTLASHSYVVFPANVQIPKNTFFGEKQFYLSDPTAEAETSVDSKTVAELYAIYDGLCTNYPHIITRLADIGMDASNTYAIREYAIRLDNPLVYEGEVSLSGDLDIEHLTNLWQDSMNNPILAITAGMHGNEKAPCWGTALAIKEIVESTEQFATFLKTNFEIRIIPCLNPWGFENVNRRNANNVDINRDFGATTKQAETTAYINWILGIADRTALALDCHGTTGYYAYYSCRGDDPYFNEYCQQNMRFTLAVQKNWSDFYGVDKYPYCYTVKGTYTGTRGIFTTSIGVLGFALETPQNYSHGNSTQWVSDLRACKLTKDLLINAMQFSGEWGAKVRGFRR